MRGKVFYFEVFAYIFGITPAYAGKSNTSRFFSLIPQDHPRVCGEK